MPEEPEGPEGKCCGGCTGFLHEDSDGAGWCRPTALCLRCDTPACFLYEPTTDSE